MYGWSSRRIFLLWNWYLNQVFGNCGWPFHTCLSELMLLDSSGITQDRRTSPYLRTHSHQQISFNEVLACVWVTIFFDNFACVCKQWLLNWWSSKHYQVEIFVTENLLLKLWHIIENGIPDYSSFTIVLLLLILHWELNKTNLYQSLTFHLLLTYYHHFFTCILARAFVQTGESVLQLFASEVCSYVLSLPK